MTSHNRRARPSHRRTGNIMTETPEVARANGHGPIVSGAPAPVPEQREPVDAPPLWALPGPLDSPQRPLPPDDDQDDAEHGAPVPVDQPPEKTPGLLPWQAPDTPKPIVPAWVLDAAQRKAAASW